MHGAISNRENFLRTVEFHRPQWVPIQFEFLPASRKRHGQGLRELMLAHPQIFDAHEADHVTHAATGPLYTAGGTYVDDWGCVWRNVHDGVLVSGWRGSYDWHDGHYHGSFHATPFFQGNRMYVRSRDELICVGPER